MEKDLGGSLRVTESSMAFKAIPRRVTKSRHGGRAVKVYFQGGPLDRQWRPIASPAPDVGWCLHWDADADREVGPLFYGPGVSEYLYVGRCTAEYRAATPERPGQLFS
jgi:hypothetical protein